MIGSMCGRFVLTNLAALLKLFPYITEQPSRAVARYNIAPGTPILAVANDKPDRYDHFLWGLIPTWAKDPSIGNKMINARAETLAEKNSFKNAYKRRRCLIPADGFYEWQRTKGGKQPMLAHLKNGEPFAFAGLWERWHGPDGEEIRSATIITTTPNELMKPIHDRMPVILHRRDFDRWLSPDEQPPSELNDLLKPFPADEMEAYPVSTRVNSPKNEGKDLVERVDMSTGELFG